MAGTSACQPSMVIAPMVPVWRLRVPGASTMVLSDSVTVDVLVDDAALSVALALEALSVVEADAAFEPSVTLAEEGPPDAAPVVAVPDAPVADGPPEAVLLIAVSSTTAASLAANARM